MYIIAGLGNPTKEYESTRHNAGFMVIDELADKYDIHVSSLQHKAMVGKGMIDSRKVILVKPQTYMNLSGESIKELVDYYKIDTPNELIIISDDIDLPPGYIRVRDRGSAGGHNGLKSIIECTGTESFIRVRVGVGQKPEGADLISHVLGHFRSDEMDAISDGIKNATDAVSLITDGRLKEAMNIYNKKVRNKENDV